MLTVNGTMYIDGSVQIQNGAVNSYTGFATIYVSGTLLIKNSSMCAVIVAGACSTQNWTSNSRMLVFVVGGNGSNIGHQSQTGAGNSILLNSARFQGALYATNGIDIATTSNADGPLDGARSRSVRASTRPGPSSPSSRPACRETRSRTQSRSRRSTKADAWRSLSQPSSSFRVSRSGAS